MPHQIVITIAFSATLLSGCTAFIATATFPSAPAMPPNSAAELAFEIAFAGKTIPVYYRWACLYSRGWAANTGTWSVSESITNQAFVKKLAQNKYLYVALPSCAEDNGTLPRIVEFDLAGGRPAPKLISAAFYDDCKQLEDTGRVSRYRKVNAPIQGSPSQMDSDEQKALEIIEGYEYEVLPVGLVRESIWSKYPDLSELLLTMKQPVTGREFAEHFLARNDSPAWRFILKGNEFPWDHQMYYRDSPEMSYAQVSNGAWKISAQPSGNNEPFSVLKKYRGENDKGDSPITKVNAFGKEIGMFGQAYDPSTRTIAIVKNTTKCF